MADSVDIHRARALAATASYHSQARADIAAAALRRLGWEATVSQRPDGRFSISVDKRAS